MRKTLGPWWLFWKIRLVNCPKSRTSRPNVSKLVAGMFLTYTRGSLANLDPIEMQNGHWQPFWFSKVQIYILHLECFDKFYWNLTIWKTKLGDDDFWRNKINHHGKCRQNSLMMGFLGNSFTVCLEIWCSNHPYSRPYSSLGQIQEKTWPLAAILNSTNGPVAHPQFKSLMNIG